MGGVQPLGGTGGEFSQLFGEFRKVGVAQVQQGPHLSPGDRDRLLGADRILDGEIAGGGVRGPVGQGRRRVAHQFEALGGPEGDAAGGPWLDLDVDEGGQLLDQAHLDVLRAGRVSRPDGGAADVGIQLGDLGQEVIYVARGGPRTVIGAGRHALQLGVDLGRLVEKGLHRRDRFRAQHAGGGIGCGGAEGVPDLVEGCEIAGLRGGIPEQALGCIEVGRDQVPTAGGGIGGQTRRDQELIDDPPDIGNLHPGANTADNAVSLVDLLPHIAGRVDVRDIVGGCPQGRLSGDHAGSRVAQHRSQRHGLEPSQPATLAQSRRVLPGSIGGACARLPKKSFHFNTAYSAAALRHTRRRKTQASRNRTSGGPSPALQGRQDSPGLS